MSAWLEKLGGDTTTAEYNVMALEIKGAGATGKLKIPQSQWRELYEYAHEEGMKAGAACVPTPMVVAQHANVADDSSPITQTWDAPEGVCGFAWITIHPGNCAFANWLKKHEKGGKAYGGGVIVNAKFGQRMERNLAYASAFAGICHKAGIKVYVGSRMD